MTRRTGLPDLILDQLMLLEASVVLTRLVDGDSFDKLEGVHQDNCHHHHDAEDCDKQCEHRNDDPSI